MACAVSHDREFKLLLIIVALTVAFVVGVDMGRKNKKNRHKTVIANTFNNFSDLSNHLQRTSSTVSSSARSLAETVVQKAQQQAPWRHLPDAESGPVKFGENYSEPKRSKTKVYDTAKKLFSISAARVAQNLSLRRKKSMESQFRTFTKTVMRLNPTRYITNKRNRGPLIGLMFVALLCAAGYYGYNYLHGNSKVRSFGTDRTYSYTGTKQSSSLFGDMMNYQKKVTAPKKQISKKSSYQKPKPVYQKKFAKSGKAGAKKTTKYTKSKPVTKKYGKAVVQKSKKSQLKSGAKKNYHKTLAKNKNR
jgi:hypothetical protein